LRIPGTSLEELKDLFVNGYPLFHLKERGWQRRKNMYIPFPLEYSPPQTKLGHLRVALTSLFALFLMEAIYAGIFAFGFAALASGVRGDELFNAILMTVLGLGASTFWPILYWSLMKNDLVSVFNPEKS